jgi:NADPH:quinone reductase-like Zn-dependent oxidoreductase
MDLEKKCRLVRTRADAKPCRQIPVLRRCKSRGKTAASIGRFPTERESRVKNWALWYRTFGEPEGVVRLEANELEPLKPGLIRVRMSISPINPSDLIPMTGTYGHRVRPPLVAGYEGVGTVTEAAASAPHLVGKRVLPLRGIGTWQHHVDCDPAWAVPVPDDIDDHLAARAYINPLAAFLMTRMWNPAGKRVLVTAAGSTCAGLLAQWALALGAREVIGIHRSPEHRPLLRRHGITPIEASDAVEVAMQARGADLAFDAVGGTLASGVLDAMRKGALFVSYGLLSAAMYSVSERGPTPSRFHVRDQLEGLAPAPWQQWFLEMWPLLRQSYLPEIRSFPMADWREALTLFRTPGRRFKPVLSFA